MESVQNKKVLISGASIAGLSTAWWMNSLGYHVTVVEMANEPRTAGGAINIEGPALEAAKRMGIYEHLLANRLIVELIEFKNADDITEGTISVASEHAVLSDDEVEIERDKFIEILYDALKNDVEFVFNNRITALMETEEDMVVSFKDESDQSFHLVLGCDGSHSGVRKLWFGPESDYEYFLDAYFSITIVDKLLVKQRVMQMFNVPDKAIMLNAYNNKTDIIFCFYSAKQILYDYKDINQQRQIILDHFAGGSWRIGELLEEVEHCPNFYFDNFAK